jgi:lysophospholipid acyltransferase (LPLAT)-like uncharacterized protein
VIRDAQANQHSRKGRVVLSHPPTPSQRLAARLVYAVERLLSASLRCRWCDHSSLTDILAEGPVIFCLWHNRLAISMIVHRLYG